MSFLSIKSNFKETHFWVFKQPLYVRVRENYIKIIILKHFIETSEELSIYDDVVTCRLNFSH